MHTPEGMLPAPEILALIPARALAGILVSNPSFFNHCAIFVKLATMRLISETLRDQRVSARDTLVGGTISWDSGFSSSCEISLLRYRA